MQKRKKIATGAALAMGAVLAPEAVEAAVITVNSTADTAAVDAQCTLREAITNANANAATEVDCAAGTGLDTIDFALTLPATITLSGTSLSIVDPLIIDGPGQTDLTIDANDASRIFEIADGDSGTSMTVEINDLTLANGNDATESFPGGGAILSAETLVITNVTFSGNDGAAGGAIYLYSPSNPNLTVTGSTFTGNTSAADGGAILAVGGDVTITGSTLTLNTALCCGGAIKKIEGAFTLTDSTVTGNSATIGGGIALYYTDTTTITNSTISGNEALLSGGGLYFYGPAGLVTIEDSVISANEAAYGGGVWLSYAGESPVVIRDTEISGNTATDSAGGLYLYDVDDVTLERVRLINNTADAYDGGGALWDAKVTIIESQISGNQAPIVGGLYVAYGSYLYLINSTVANNTASTGSVGGLGINFSFAAIDVSTISGNSAPAGAAGNIFSYGSGLYITNSIVANGIALAGPDLVTATSTVEINYSLIEDTAGASFTGSNNITGVDPQLGPLQNNGGPTETVKPAPASPVVNAGDPLYTTPPNDQRGFPRPVGIVDMGAVELSPGVLDISAANAVGEGAGFITITVTRTGGSDGAASVNYTTNSGTATSGADFTATAGTLNWADGDAAPKSFNVNITDDLIFEGNEQFTVTLSGATVATLGADTALITITDNDAAPTISINDTGNTEGSNVVFNVTLSNPTTQTVTVDFATAGVTAASGVDFTANSGTITFNPLVTSQPITIVTTQDAIDEPNETFNVVLTNPNANATIFDGTGVGTITDDDPTPTISINDAGQTEGTNIVFQVTLSGASSETITVDFATAAVTATSGTDFTANSGTITFTPGDTSEQITVVTAQDAVDEANETFNVNLTNPSAGATILDGTGVGTIGDDDPSPTISIGDSGALEGANVVFNVTLSAPTEQVVTVDFATAGNTATSGVDFTPNSGTLTFNPLVTSQQITVATSPDGFDEPNETFNVVLTNPNANAVLLDDTAIGTITDDDGAPALSIDDVTLAEGNAGTTNFVFNVTLAPASGQTVTVDYTTSGGDATAGSDYTPTSGTLTFTPGDTSETITVTVAGDTSIEPTETFNVVLSNAPLAAITDATGQGTITNDDVAPVADLSLTKAVVGSGPFVVGQNATFTITLSNAGPDAAANATVTDILPAGTTFVSATPTSGTCNGTTTVICNVGTLANGANATVTLTVQLNTPGTITNTATGASEAGDLSPALGTAAINVTAAAEGVAIPTLSQWMLIALAAALACLGVRRP